MSFFGFSFISTEPVAPTIKKREEDTFFPHREDSTEDMSDESKDEQNVERSLIKDHEHRTPAEDHFGDVPEEEEDVVEEEEEVEAKPGDQLMVDVTPAQVEEMNPVSPSPRAPLECDYDINPTHLYQNLQLRNWEKTIELCKTHENEARTWVLRKESNGKLRWRLLPLHAAVIFKAPDEVIKALLAAYPRGAESKDDQGMLPLHLAFRNGGSDSVVNLLLAAYPQSIEVKDRKGRIPLHLAQASTSPNRDSFMRALERGPNYYAAAAAATERAAVTAEQKAMFDAKLREKEEAHREEIEMLRTDAEQKQMDLEEKIKELTDDLEKNRETSQVLIEHVNTLEAQLNSRTDTERFLATRIAALDVDLRETAKVKEEIENSLKTENENLKKEKAMMEDELKALKEENAAQREKLEATEAQLAKFQEDYDTEHKELQSSLISLQKEWASAKASEAILEAQLKKRIKSEKGLAGEVSFLASRLAESAHESGESVGNYSHRVRTLEKERDELRYTVKALSIKLGNVAIALNDMMTEQENIVEAAAQHDLNMAEAADIHNKLVVHARRHQELFESAQQERAELAQAIKRQEEEAALQSEERRAILEAFELQEEQMEDASKERKHLIYRVTQQRLEIQNLIAKNLSDISPVLNIKDDEVVDEMVNFVMSPDTIEAEVKSVSSLEEALRRIDARIESNKAEQVSTMEDVPEEDTPDEDASDGAWNDAWVT